MNTVSAGVAAPGVAAAETPEDRDVRGEGAAALIADSPMLMGGGRVPGGGGGGGAGVCSNASREDVDEVC